MTQTVNISEYQNGAHVGVGCDHCANVATLVLIAGSESMALCSECHS